MSMGETGTEDEWMMGEAVGGGEQDERREGKLLSGCKNK